MSHQRPPKPNYWVNTMTTCCACGYTTSISFSPGVYQTPQRTPCSQCDSTRREVKTIKWSTIVATVVCGACDWQNDKDMKPGARFPLKCPHCGRQALRLHPDVRYARGPV